MAVGFLIGPSGLALLSQETMSNSRILIDIALALILYRLGLSIDIREILRNPRFLLVSVIESCVTFGAVLYVLHFFGLPLVVSAVIAAISISSSPAVLLHVAHEVGATGRVTDSSKTLVALNNCISFLAFSAVLPALHQSVGSTWTEMIMQPTYRFLGSLLVGFILGMALHQLATRMSAASQYGLAIVIGSIMIAVGIADFLKLSLLIVPLLMGITISTVESKKHVSSIEFGSAFELFFIVLFVYAGANLHLHEIIESAFLVFLLFLVRSLAKVLSVASTSPLQSLAVRDGFSSGLLIIPMAGLAIGLAQTTSNLFPEYANTVSAIVLGSVVLFETVGPPIAKFAFDFCRESERMRSLKKHNLSD
jgi:Kef-type K+ transport system membrane component KefB